MSMMMNDVNPWEVDEVAAFSYFCCPECEFKAKAVPTFLSHANENHPRAKDFYSTQLEQEIANPKVKCEIEVKEDLTSDDPDHLTYTQDSGPNQDPIELIGDIKKEFKENDEPLVKRKRKTKHKSKLKAEELPIEGNEISCATCEYEFPSIYDLSIHNVDEHQEDKYLVICPICNFSTKHKRSLKVHIKEKHETSKVPCPECNRMIKETTLTVHMASSHSDSEKKHKCTYQDCDFKSNHASSLSYHIRTMHPIDSMQHQFACDKCTKTYPYASGLKQHVDMVHLKLKSFVCEQCGKGFNSRIQFNEHQALPSCNFMSGTDVIFNCDKCRDTFDTLRGYIRHHQVMHGDFPPNLPKDSNLPTFMCDECPKIYLKQSALESHKKQVHRGILPKSNNK